MRKIQFTDDLPMVGGAARLKDAQNGTYRFVFEREYPMPRLSKSLPKYRKHKASGQAVVNLSGKDHYLGPHGNKASKLEYDRLIGEWLANGRSLPSTAAELATTINQLCAAYWKFCKKYYVKNGKPTDEQAGVRASIRHLRKKYGKTAAEEFGPLALAAVREQMIAAGNSRRYINQNIGRLKRMFRWGVSKELIPVEVYQRLQTVAGLKKGKTDAVERDTIMPVDEVTVAATLPHLKPIIADMVQIQLLTGCRPGEVCSMRRNEIDRSNKVWSYRPDSHLSLIHI